MVSSVFILLPFLTVSQHESGTRTTISWSVIIYSKTFFSQCNLNAQIEPVQDKYMYSLFTACLHYIKSMINSFFLGAAIVIVWQLDLQLQVQSVPVTTKVVSSNPVHGEVYLIQHYVIKFVSDLRQVGDFLQFPRPINPRPPRYNCNIVESGGKHHKQNHLSQFNYFCESFCCTRIIFF